SYRPRPSPSHPARLYCHRRDFTSLDCEVKIPRAKAKFVKAKFVVMRTWQCKAWERKSCRKSSLSKARSHALMASRLQRCRNASGG
ncbi:MAG: hypothetical protein ACK56F_13345, partial [bacterium]